MMYEKECAQANDSTKVAKVKCNECPPIEWSYEGYTSEHTFENISGVTCSARRHYYAILSKKS